MVPKATVCSALLHSTLVAYTQVGPDSTCLTQIRAMEYIT